MSGTRAEAPVAQVSGRRRELVRLSLEACAHCALCADSCFKYRQSGGNPEFTPSYKAINTIGKIVRKRGRLGDGEYARIAELAWDRCVLCMRCRCPVGIDIPYLISLARSACRARGLERDYRREGNA